jgi:two-component system chemotaxis sensor kinase CheA
MDVVKATLERVGGALRIRSEAGRGTRLALELPLTVAIIHVLVVEVGGIAAVGEAGGPSDGRDAYAIPLNRVERAVDLDVTAVSEAQGRRWLRIGAAGDGALVPLFDLPLELGYGGGEAQRGTVLLVGRQPNVVALRVDAILGQEEVVAKPLGLPLGALPYLSGATLLADGRAAFILEPARLVVRG